MSSNEDPSVTEYFKIIQETVDENVTRDEAGNIVYLIWRDRESHPRVVIVSPEVAIKRLELFKNTQQGVN